MSDWPPTVALPPSPFSALGPYDPWSGPVGQAVLNTRASLSTSAWPVAETAYYVPVLVHRAVTAQTMMCEVGLTSSGNLDLGIYDEVGTRLVSTGSTAVGAASTLQVVDLANTQLSPGAYFLAMAVDNATATFARMNVGVPLLRAFYVREQASAFPLPATAVFAALASAYLPAFAASLVATA